MVPAPELLAPAGNWECVRAAVANGADAVYFGLPRFNARIRADNFSEDEIPEVVRFCHRFGVKAYVAFNTLIFTQELDAAAQSLRMLSRAGVDALIVQDVGVVRLAQSIVPDLPIHASTQMTLTSPEGVDFARELGVRRVVLGREVSLREMARFETRAAGSMPLEVFVHGALCVAYSGQCLTSESLGQRSANRGECAQACRMPYDLVVDGRTLPLEDKRYLLSPQDLAAVDHIPELLNLGIRALKIEGRLKSPEYVAAVCQVYRKALDRALEGQRAAASDTDRYQLEMTFSRGLFPGWLEGVNHQELVPARYGKKRGPFAGKIRKVAKDHVEIRPETPLQPGDGVVFDTGEDPNREQGGRIFSIQDDRLFFRHGHIDFSRIKPGDRLWKTHDPALEKNLRRTFSGSVAMRRRIPLVAAVFGKAGEPLRVRVRAGSRTDDTFQFETEVASMEILAEANRAPLTRETLAAQLGRLEQSPFALESLENHLEGPVILPISALNKVRRALVAHLEEALPELAGCPRRETPKEWRELLADSAPEGTPGPEGEPVSLSVLCRDMPQVEAALGKRVLDLVLDFEDVRRYRDAVAWIREHASTDSPAFSPTVWLATPRIQKAGEHGFFRLLENASADGVLVRNLGALDFFKNRAARPTARLRGDFSLNVANPLTATEFLKRGMERLTLSYDLTAEQVCDLMDALPAVLRERIEITLHQHMPMFHMEHCVFAAFLSEGKSHLDCGRPCERHRVHLRDRVGVEHPLRADAGCRNTLFNAAAQTGAPFYETLHAAGLKRFRIELLEQTREQSERVIDAYRSLLEGNRSGAELWKSLRVKSQLGVTSGTLSAKLGA